MHFDNLLMDKLHWGEKARSIQKTRYRLGAERRAERNNKSLLELKIETKKAAREIRWRYNLHTKQLYSMSEMLQSIFSSARLSFEISTAKPWL
jgi:hypothetical protein